MAYSGSFQLKPRENAPAPPERDPSVPAAPRPAEKRPPVDLGALFGKTEIAGMETDDLLMALILYLMYRESGDRDLLIMLGVMLLT